jgi:phage-related protein
MSHIRYTRLVRPVVFHPKARDEIRGFPKEVRSRPGRGLFRLQSGETFGMPQPATHAGGGRRQHGIFRAFYITATAKGVLVFHAFAKKTQRTPPPEVELARKR